MTAPELSPDEQIVLAFIEDQAEAPESFRYRIAKALFDYDDGHEDRWPAYTEPGPDYLGVYGDFADIAIAVMRGER